MRKLWRSRAQRVVNKHLFVGVGQMILTANDVGYTHLDVVNDYREVVQGMTIRANQNQVFDVRVIALLQTVDNIFEARDTRCGYLQPNGGGLTRLDTLERFFKEQVAINVFF